jgi:hypothetical protein
MSEECFVLGRDEIHAQNFDQETRNDGATERTWGMWEDKNQIDHSKTQLKWINCH